MKNKLGLILTLAGLVTSVKGADTLVKISNLPSTNYIVNEDILPVVTGVSITPKTYKITGSDLKYFILYPAITGTNNNEGAGGPVNIFGGPSGTNANGGLILIQSGYSSSGASSGSVTIGSTNNTTGATGAISLRSGNAGTSSGAVTIRTGTAETNTAGAISLLSGASTLSNGGGVGVAAGNGGAAGGSISFTGGNGGTGDGGSITFIAGTSGNPSLTPATIIRTAAGRTNGEIVKVFNGSSGSVANELFGVPYDSGIILKSSTNAPSSTLTTKHATLFLVDNGAGKMVLKIQFPSGVAQTIATEP